MRPKILDLLDAPGRTAGGATPTASPVSLCQFTLPAPPSWNELYRFGQKRMYKTSAYRAWMQMAVALAMQQRTPAVAGFIAVDYVVPANRRRDLDNFLKPLNDALETIGIVHNDNRIRSLSISEAIRDDVLVRIRPLEAA